jgi:hypothetical protein
MLRRLLFPAVFLLLSATLSATPTHLGVSYAPFLPSTTLATTVRFDLCSSISAGASVGGFFVLGRAVFAELFVEPVWYSQATHGAQSGWRLSSRVGALVGWAREFSFGPPPVHFAGTGVHLVPLEALYQWDGWYLGGYLGLGVLSDFTRLSATAEIGVSLGITDAR